MKKFLLAIVTASVIISSSGCEKVGIGYDAGYLEKKLILPYNITASLTAVPLGVRADTDPAVWEAYDVLISSGELDGLPSVDLFGDFKIEFKSGEVTDGLTVEFFSDGVFISFDDLRFKTNSALFTRLEMIKNAFSQFSRSDVAKKQEDAEPVAGVDITEISADADGISYRALVNKKDGSLIRLTAESDSDKLILDIKQFDTIVEPFEKDITTTDGVPAQETDTSAGDEDVYITEGTQ